MDGLAKTGFSCPWSRIAGAPEPPDVDVLPGPERPGVTRRTTDQGRPGFAAAERGGRSRGAGPRPRRCGTGSAAGTSRRAGRTMRSSPGRCAPVRWWRTSTAGCGPISACNHGVGPRKTRGGWQRRASGGMGPDSMIAGSRRLDATWTGANVSKKPEKQPTCDRLSGHRRLPSVFRPSPGNQFAPP